MMFPRTAQSGLEVYHQPHNLVTQGKTHPDNLKYSFDLHSLIPSWSGV
jgi:hypothetical protein